MNLVKSGSEFLVQSYNQIRNTCALSGRHILALCLILLLLGFVGCSYFYDLHLEGELLSGPAKTPVSGATVTLYSGTHDYGSCTTDKEGKWVLTESIHDSAFRKDRDGKYRLYVNASSSLRIRIITNKKAYIVPCPRVAIPESGSDIYAFVLTVLQVEPEEEIAEKEVKP